MDNSRIDDFYNDLVQSGFTFGGKTDRASYDAMMADDARSKKLYGILTDRGWDLDDYDTWRKGFSSQQPNSAEQSTVAQPNTAAQQMVQGQQSQPMQAPQGGGEDGNEFTAQQLDGINPINNTSRLDPKYQLDDNGRVKPFAMLETESTTDEQGNTVRRPKLVKGADGTDVYRNAMTGEEYSPLSPEAMEMVGQNTMTIDPNAKRAKDPSVLETIGKSLGAGFTRAGAGIVDVLQQLSSGMYVESGDGYIMTPSYEEARKDKNNAITKASDLMHETADRMSREAQPYGGEKGFLDLLWDGEIGKFAQKGLATAGESLPMTLSAYNPYTMVLNAISMAGSNYRDETIENPDTPAWKRASYAIGQAAIEQAVEKYADPVFKYIGGSKGKEVAEDITKEATQSIAKRIYDVLKDAAGEGVEEVATNFGNDALGEVLDILDSDKDYGIRAQWEKMKEENPNANLSDFAMAKAKENVEAFIGGALAGAYTSGTAQVSNAALMYAFGNNENVPDGVKLDPVTVNVAQSFDDGYSFEIPQEKNDAKNMYDVQRERMNGIVDEDTLNDIEKDPLSWIVANKDNLVAEDLQAVLDYVNAKATYDGMIQKVSDDIESQCAAFDELIDSRTNRAGANAGMLVPATMKMDDRQVFVIDGDIQMLDDGSMVDVSKSSESILVRDAETGKLEFVSPRDVLNVGEAVDAEQEKAMVREDTTRQMAQEQAQQMEGVLAFNAGDVYSILDNQGNTNQVEVLADNGDGTVMVSIDGSEPMPYPKDVLQQLSDNESKARAAERAAMNSAENATANGTAENGEGVAQPAADATGTVAEAPAANAEGTVAAEPMPMVGEGDNAEPDFLATTPERGLSFLFGESGWEESDADAFLANNVTASAKEVEKLEGKRPKAGTNFAKFNKDMAAWNASKQEAAAKAEYWQKMKELRDAIVAEKNAERKAAEQARQDAERAAAEKDEAAYRAEQERLAAEQAERGSNVVGQNIIDKWNSAEKVVGAADELVLPNGEKVKGHYVLVESGAASPSHDANNGFVKSEGFPVDVNGNSVNDRDYERDKDAQRVTRQMADNYDARAIQNTVVVSGDGVVLSGNGRTMAGELAAAQNTDGAYVEALKMNPGKFGFTASDMEGMVHPRVVFVLDEAMPYTAETFAKFNQQEMKSQSKTEQAVKLGKVVDDATYNRIVKLISGFERLTDFYNDQAAAREAISELQKAGVISDAQVAEMLDGEGISNVGRDVLENMLVGKAFDNDPDAVRKISELRSMRQAIIMALSEISANKALGEDYSLENELAQAIDLVYQARKSGGYKAGERVSGYARQGNLDFFGENATVGDITNVTVMQMADIINDNKPSMLKTYLKSYNEQSALAASGQLDLFSGGLESKQDILNNAKQLYNEQSERQEPGAESAEEAGTIDNGGEAGETADKITPEQQALLDGNNPHQYPDGREVKRDVSEREDSNNIANGQNTAVENAEIGSNEGETEGADDKNANNEPEVLNLNGEEYSVADIEASVRSDVESIIEENGLDAEIVGVKVIGSYMRGEQREDSDIDVLVEYKGNEREDTMFNIINSWYEENDVTLNGVKIDVNPITEGKSGTIEQFMKRNGGFSKNNPTADAAGTVADAIAAAEAETETNPTQAQKEAGNYKKGHVKVDGYDITIENPKGSERSGKDADGKEWSVTMNNTYGYIRGTEGVDGDHIDVFLSDNPEQGNVYVVDQVKADGSFDEHKVMYGFGSAEEAREAYLANYSEGWTGLGTITEVSKEEFKKWIESSHRKTKPFSEYKSVKKEGAQGEEPKSAGDNDVTDKDVERWLKEDKELRAVRSDGQNVESFDDYMRRVATSATDRLASRAYVYEVYGENVPEAIEDAYPYVLTKENAAEVARDLKQQQFDEDGCVAILRGILKAKSEAILPFLDEVYGSKNAPAEKQQPSTAAGESETNVDKAIRIMKEIDDLSSELDELYVNGPEAEAERVSAEHMAKYGELEALEKSMTDEEKEALDKRLREDEDELDGEWAEWLEAGMKEETGETITPDTSDTSEPQKPNKPKKPAQRKPRKSKPSATTAGDEKIEDVGEKIGGARKDATLNYAKKIDLEATTPSKIFPKPNFASMEKAGVPHETLVKLKAYYTAFSITNKNKRKRNENQRILSARFYASIARDMLLRDVDVFNESADGIVLTEYGKQHLELLVACVEALDKKGMAGFFDLDISDVDVHIGEFKENEQGAYQTKDGKRWVGTYSFGRTNNKAAIGYKLFALDDIEGLAEEYCKQVEAAHSKNVQNEIKMHVYRVSTGTCYISAKVKGIADEIKLKDGFATSKEAFDYIRENGDALKTEARAKADEMKQGKKNGGTRKPTNDDIERMLRNIVQGTRIGKDYRNGKDVSADDFMKEFGFRGVEFGNWATQKERQDHLNACYDALMDLADLIGISPKAISLGGKLAMAFGSRGRSSALAHYEPAKHVINLTKEHGAGCVAHEWFHAVDNYFGGGVFGLHMKSAVEGNSRDNLRSEMQKIFTEIGRTLNGSDMKSRSKKLGNGDYWASTLEMAARAFESYVNERLMERGQKNQYLSAHVPGEAVEYEALAKNDPYPTAEESKKFGEIFDRLFDTVQEEVGDDGNVNLFQIADVEPGTENVTEAQQLATEAIITALGENAGIDVVMETREEGQRVAGMEDAGAELMAVEAVKDETLDYFRKSVSGDITGKPMPIGKLTPEGREYLMRLSGIDMKEDVDFVLNPSDMTHIYNEHYGENEKDPGNNNPLNDDDIRNIVDIIENPDEVVFFIDLKHDNRKTFIFFKETEVDGVYNLAEVYGDRKGNLTAKSLYKTKKGISQREDELINSPHTTSVTTGASLSFGAKIPQLFELPKLSEGNQPNTAEFMQVWHGSAAIFDHFDGAFMGTGEGSQVYGDGHYVTGVESTGRMYATIATENRQRSSEPIVRWKGQQVDFSSVNPLRMAHDVADSSRTIKEARERAERYADMAEEQEMKNKWSIALDILKQSTKADFKPVPVKGNRQLYEVEIPDDNGKNYLNWNDAVPVSEQDKIEELLFAEVVNDKESDYTEKDRKQFHDDMGFGNKNLSVGDLYGTMTFALGSKKAASALLRKAGFVGVKVPTGNRRGGDGRGMNYVIFNDNDLKITDRVQFMQRPEGTVYGWSEGNRIHLTPEGVNPNTPIHEYTHLWAKAVMQKNPKLWNRIKELLQGTPIWDEVVNDPAYQGLTTDDAIASEALSRLSGRNNATKMEKMAQELLDEAKGNGVFAEANAHNLILKMKQALKDFWKWVGVNLFDITDVKNIDEVTDRVLYDLLNKTDLEASENHGDAMEFSIVTKGNATEQDQKAMDEIANGKTETVYRSMQVIEIGGKRYALPPMASKVNGEFVQGVEIHEDGTLEPILLKADEHPELAKNGKFYLDKGNGKGLWAAYNPYWHVIRKTDKSSGMLNDQFSEAQSRNNLITVEGVIPSSEMKAEYKAAKAKDAVGVHEWKAGVIAGQLTGKREVVLSRYFQGVRVVPDAEVAENIYRDIDGKVDVMPSNVVPVGVRAELEKLGVKFVETDNMNQLIDGEHKGDRYTWWYGKNQEQNRYKAFRERAVAEYMHLEDWLEKEGRTGQIDEDKVKRCDKTIDKSIQKQKEKDGQNGSEENATLDEVNNRYNEQLAGYTTENADSVILNLGMPSEILKKAGVEDKPMKLYGSKIAKKQKKHGFDVNDLRDLPRAMANPIAVFDNYGKEGNRSVLTELKTNNGNILVAVDLGKGGDIDFNIISSAFGKAEGNIEDWLSRGLATYIDNKKVQDYLHLAALSAAASDNTGLSSGAKIQPNNELNKFLGEKLYIRTENFKNWFGDWQKEPKSASKVVDKNGEPLVVYHGTQHMEYYTKDGHLYTRWTEPFYSFKEGKGFFTDDEDAAKTFARGRQGLYACYLNMRNPFEFDCHGMSWDEIKGYKNPDGYTMVTTDYIVRDIKSRFPEYDGVIFRNVGSENNGAIRHTIDDYVPFKPEQIKSATENNGEFDAENPDIRFRERTEFDDGEVLDIVHDTVANEYSLADSTMLSYQSKEQLLRAFQEKHPSYAAVLTADGNGIEVMAWKDVLKHIVKNRRSKNGEPTKAEKQRAAYVERKTQIAIKMVNEKAQKLGLNVEVLTDTEGLPEKLADKKGWYNKATGKITIVLPNHFNGLDVMRTLMHEGVAHHGLRQMFGKDFDTFLDNVYANADIEVRRKIAEMAARKGWDFHTATEEYLAALAEDIDFERNVDQMWWQKVKFFFVDMLRKAGIVLGDKLTDNDLRFILWKSYEHMAYADEYGAIRDARTEVMKQELGVGNYAPSADAQGTVAEGPKSAKQNTAADGSGLLFRDGDEDTTPLSLQESMIQGLIDLAQKNKENAAYKTYVVKAIGGELAKLRKAMSAQKEYDRSTVEQMTGLARLLIKNGMLSNMSEPEMLRLLTIIKNATGRNDITKAAQQVYDLMIKNQLEEAKNMLDQVTHVRGSKVNAQGVEVQGTLDVRGQQLIKAFRKAMSLDEANISELLQNASDRMDSPDAAIADEAATEYAALTLALQYVHDIKDSVADEKLAKEELEKAREAHAAKTDGLSAKAYKEYVQEAEDAIRQKKLERIEAYHNLAARLAGAMQGSIESAKQFREREMERVKNIHHFANSDMQGRPANAHRVDNWKQKVLNNPFFRFMFNPLGTFDQMLRMIGNKSVNGEGYLYNHFMRGWLDATQKEFENFHAACKVLDNKASEVFGKKMRWSDLYAEERKMPKAQITFTDVDGSERTVELNQGNLLYIYMAEKMADGRMKLRAMGITEEDIENIKEVLDPRFVKLADWLQEEFLVQKRNDYNAVHERMFGAPMAAIENYFPLRILGDARVQQVDVAEDKIENELPSILTGSIIKRRTNKNPLDVMNTDAFSVVVEHLQQMEKWAAFAEWRRDLNTLLSYKRFRNQLKNMSSVYGAGNTLWRNFMIAGSIAAGTHRPKVDYDGVDTTLVNVAKGVTTAKIAFRVFTAIKQLLSAPAFMAEANWLNLAKSIATPWKAWNWAMEELPTFKKRWQSKQAGDSRLMKTDVDWRFWKNRLVETLSRWGMSPNAFVDAMTVAIGGRAIYETKYARYIEDGYSEAEADKKAKQDAAVLVNQTQQSSETAFVSKMQLDRTVAAVSLSVFRNSPMSYQRQLVDAIRGLKRMATPGYKEESIDFMAKQMVRDGLDEDAAKRAATRAYNREWVRNLSRTALFGFGMQMAWNLGAYLPYLIFGDDDDEKKEMLEDAAVHGLFGSIEGLSGGNLISELGNMKVKGESLRNYDMSLLPLMSDIRNIYTKLETDEVAAVNDMVNLLVQSGIGVNPQTITDAIVAITDACNGDVKTGREATMLFLRLSQAPQSQIDKLYLDEIGMRGKEASKLSVQDLAKRYAQYKKNRNAPLAQWAYSDEAEQKVIDKHIKKFETQAKERLMQTTGDAKLDDAYEAYEENYKDVKKRLEAVNKLKDEDFTEFYTKMGELATTPEFRKYDIFKGYKSVIDKLKKAALDAKDGEEREHYLQMIDDRKRQMVEMLDSMK